jgi:hypothetical protein
MSEVSEAMGGMWLETGVSRKGLTRKSNNISSERNKIVPVSQFPEGISGA